MNRIYAFVLLVITCNVVSATDPGLGERIDQLINTRPTDFPPHHPRHQLFTPVIEAFNSARHSPDRAELKQLGVKAIMAKFNLFKLHNSRIETEPGNDLYKHDNIIISNILDYTQSAIDHEYNLKGLNALKVLSDRINPRELMKILPGSDHGINELVEAIWELLRNHGLVISGDVTKENIQGALKFLAHI